jgi:hypothetical protein
MRDVHLSLASATEHKLTGGEYLGRKPVGLQDFEAVGLGALPNTATPAEMYLDVLKRSLVNLIYYDPPNSYLRTG